METQNGPRKSPVLTWIRSNVPLLVVLAILAVLPIILALAEGYSIADLLANRRGNATFIQALLIEVFILAIYAISYDLVLGITGLLSFGHAMFFAVGAYLTGIMMKSFGWSFFPTLGLVVIAGVLQAILFAAVLPRVKGLTFALVTLGLASAVLILIGTHELQPFTGADVGLQGIPKPEFLHPVRQRLRFYFITMAFTVIVYLLYRRFVDSPTGRVCLAIRDNEDRARMLGFNTFYFKLTALTVASITAALAGALHSVFAFTVSPEVASMDYTVDALLIILIGGMGTLSGAMVGAGLFKLSDFYFDKWFGESATFILGAVYVIFVLFVPYGIVGTWMLRGLHWRQGWNRLLRLFTGRSQRATGKG